VVYFSARKALLFSFALVVKCYDPVAGCIRCCQMTRDLLVQPQKEERTPVSAALSAFTRADENRDTDVA
jgi:hypothetical protein